MAKKILHISGCDKFIPPFVEFIKEHFDFKQHEFLLTGGMAEDKLIKANNVHLAKKGKLARLRHYFKVLIKMHQADKVILHGLFDIYLVIILFFTPWLLKKCYWVMWGGDLYSYKLAKRNWNWKVREFFRRSVIKKMGYLVTYIKGDVQLAREWYGAKGEYCECIMYASNVYSEYKIPARRSKTINILVGNSADPSNNHIEVLNKLLPYKNENICIYVPLSYGNQMHAQSVVNKGKGLFAKKFKPLTEFMPFDEYLKVLAEVDVAIFNHKRQQAMGNTITLLGLGKTVYIRSNTSQWKLFNDKSIVVGDVDKMNLFDNLKVDNNLNIVKEYFSMENLIQQYNQLFL